MIEFDFKFILNANVPSFFRLSKCHIFISQAGSYTVMKLNRNILFGLGVGLRSKEVSSPYCTEDELADFWDGETIPAFDRFQDMEELHAKGRGKCAVHGNKINSYNFSYICYYSFPYHHHQGSTYPRRRVFQDGA
jgi:hypothetical protein